jgi:hypothetical protein
VQIRSGSLFTPYNLLKSEHKWFLVVIVCAVIIRSIPQLISFPYPIGYDVVNYYIPVTAHFLAYWPIISQQFPLYAILLKSVSLLTNLDNQTVVSALAIIVYAIFEAALYLLGNKTFGFTPKKSAIFSILIGLQFAVLRTTWDLHRDMLALSAVVFSIVFLSSSKLFGAKNLGLAICMSCFAAASDRMIGGLFALTLVIWLLKNRQFKRLLFPAVASVTTVLLLSLSSLIPVSNNVVNEAISTPQPNESPASGANDSGNLRVLFFVLDGLLLIPGLYGFFKSKIQPLKIFMLISAVGVAVGIALPNIPQIGADRWIVLLGIILSVHAAYGIIQFSKTYRSILARAIVPATLIGSLCFAICYEILPYDHPLVMLALFRNSVETYVPTTMQFSTIDVKRTGDLISEISYINNHTEPGAIIVGNKELNGFMQMYLTDYRTYQYSDNPVTLIKRLENSNSDAVYYFAFGDNVFLTRCSSKDPLLS